MEACDEGAGNASFDLESQTATILGTQSNADFVVTYHETLSDAQSGTSAISSPYVAVDGTEIYVRVEDIDAVGSMSGCASTNTSFNLVVNDAPEAYATPNQELCDDGSGSNIFDLTLNEAVTIGTQTNVSVSYYTSQIDAETSTNAINNPTAYSNTNSPQTIFVKVENSSASECYAITSFDIALYETPETQFGDVVYEVCPNATTPITVTAIPDNYMSNEVSIVWYDQNDNIIPGENSLDLDTVLTEGVYTIEVTFNDTGCSNTATVDVYELDSCIIPQGISPNNDGLNDNFDLSSFDVQRLEIYNRYGTLVYSKDTYSNEWHGQSNDGEELPVGTYYFVMKYQGSKQKAAWVYINR